MTVFYTFKIQLEIVWSFDDYLLCMTNALFTLHRPSIRRPLSLFWLSKPFFRLEIAKSIDLIGKANTRNPHALMVEIGVRAEENGWMD